MNCPSRVSGKSESDPIHVGTAQDGSAMALAVDFLLSNLFCCKELMRVKNNVKPETKLTPFLITEMLETLPGKTLQAGLPGLYFMLD